MEESGIKVMKMEFNETLIAGGKILGIEICEDMLNQFRIHYEALDEYRKQVNLTSVEGKKDVAVKHFLDSLTCLKAIDIKDGWDLVDIGTGAGFPGVPLKVANPSLALTLLESSKKRVGFLESLIPRLALTKTKVIWGRAEDKGRAAKYRENYDLAVARGVAELSVLVELCLPFVRLGGVFIALKGPGIRKELPVAMEAMEIMGGVIESVLPLELPWNYGERRIIVIRKEASTPKKFPRRPGIPGKRPIVRK